MISTGAWPRRPAKGATLPPSRESRGVEPGEAPCGCPGRGEERRPAALGWKEQFSGAASWQCTCSGSRLPWRRPPRRICRRSAHSAPGGPGHRRQGRGPWGHHSRWQARDLVVFGHGRSPTGRIQAGPSTRRSARFHPSAPPLLPRLRRDALRQDSRGKARGRAVPRGTKGCPTLEPGGGRSFVARGPEVLELGAPGGLTRKTFKGRLSYVGLEKNLQFTPAREADRSGSPGRWRTSRKRTASD